MRLGRHDIPQPETVRRGVGPRGPFARALGRLGTCAALALAVALPGTAARADNAATLSTIQMGTEQKVTFTNDYTPDPVEVKIPTGLVTKQLTGDEDLALGEGMFTFGAYEASGFNVADDGTITGTKVASGSNLADDKDGLVERYEAFTVTQSATPVRAVTPTAVQFAETYIEATGVTGENFTSYYVYNSGSYVKASGEYSAARTYYARSLTPSDPHAAELYELDDTTGTYVLTKDTTVDEAKTYYTVVFSTEDPKASGYYEKSGDIYVLTDDETLDQAKTYYTVTHSPANPSTYQHYDASTGVYSYLYEVADDAYRRTTDTTPDMGKTYYLRSYAPVTDAATTIDGSDARATNRVADVSWENMVNESTKTADNPQGATYLTFATPTPEGSPAMYYIVEQRSDPITGVIYSTTQYQMQVTVECVNGELVPSYEIYLGSTRLFATTQALDRQVNFTNQYAPEGVLSSPTDEDTVTISTSAGLMSYPVVDGTVTINGVAYEVQGTGAGRHITFDGKAYPIIADHQIDLRKSLLGRTQHDGEFSYALYAEADWNATDNVPVDGAVPVVRGASGTYDGSAQVAPITINQIAFTKAGTYTYYLVEEGTDGAAGIYFDHSVLKAVATVTADTDNATFDVSWAVTEHVHGDDPSKVHEGTRAAADDNLSEGIGTYTFNNEYYPEPDTTDGAAITKTLTGRDWIDADTFQIRVVAEEGAPALDFTGTDTAYQRDAKLESTTHNEDGTVTYLYTLRDATTPNQALFKPGVRTVDVSYFDGVDERDYTENGISFTARRKSWTYAISEVIPAEAVEGVLNGVTYDAHTVTVTVTATDNLAGQITTASAVTGGSTTFENVYQASITTSPLQVTKTLIDHQLVANTFGIRINPVGPVSREKINGLTDIQTLQHEGAEAGEAGAYTNLGALASLSFTQDDLADAATAADGTRTKTYTYEVRENSSTSVEYEYDLTLYTVAITLADDGKGSLSTTTVVSRPLATGEASNNDLGTYTTSAGHQGVEGQEDAPAHVGFTNTYLGTGSLDLDIAKTLSGRTAHEGEFGFTLTQLQPDGAVEADESYVPYQETVTNRAASAGTAAGVPFTSLAYSVAELENMTRKGYATRTYDPVSGNATYVLKYHVEEGAAFAGGTFPAYAGGGSKQGLSLADKGISQGKSEFDFTVSVADDGRGNLTATPSYGDEGIDFVNTYRASGVALLQVEKYLEGRELREATVVTIDGVSYLVSNGAITVGDTSYPVENGQVTVDGTAYDVTSLFRFNLSTDETDDQLPMVTVDGVTSPSLSVANQIPASDAADQHRATATFGLVHFDQDDVREAPYVYVVTEDQTTHASGYTYSPDVKLIMPVLVDNEDGTLSMRTGLDSDEYLPISGGEVPSGAGSRYVTMGVGGAEQQVLRLEPINHNVTFTNAYTSDYATQTITATKIMPEGGLASKLFWFRLVPEGDAPLIDPEADGNEALTTHDDEASYDTQSVWLFDAAGNDVTHGDTTAAAYMEATNNFSSVNFGNFRFAEAGTYTYLLSEIIADSATAEVNTTASDAAHAEVPGSSINVTYANRASLSDALKANTGLTWRSGDYLYDDTQYRVSVTVVDHGDGQLAVDAITYQNLGTTVRQDTNPATAVTPRFLNHNTFRAASGNAVITISKQLLNRNYWVNRTGDQRRAEKFNYFPTQALSNETYSFTIDALGQAASYTADAPNINAATGLPDWREVQATITVGTNSYPIYRIGYTNVTTGETVRDVLAYYNGGLGQYVPVISSTAADGAVTYAVDEGAAPIDEADNNITAIARTEVGTGEKSDVPMPLGDIFDHWGTQDFLALVSASGTGDAATLATISKDFSVSVEPELLISTSTGLNRADFYYRMYENAPNDATLTLTEPLDTDGDGAADYEPGTYVLRHGTDENGGYGTGDDQFSVDPETEARVASGEYKVADGGLRLYVSQSDDLEWTYKGVTYQAKPFYIRITVTSSLNSPTLLASVSYSDGTIGANGAMEFSTGGSSIPIFANEYEATGTARLTATKELLSYDWARTVWATDGEGNATSEGFTFAISPIGTAPMPTDASGNTVGTITVTKDGETSATNPDIRTGHSASITYSLTDLRNAGTNGIAEGDFIYQISEQAPSAAEQEARGLTYDDATLYAKVHVSDNMDGTLKTEVSYYTDATCTTPVTFGGGETGTTYVASTDTAVDPLKTYFKAGAGNHEKVWSPTEGNLKAGLYLEQAEREGAVFTNVGLSSVAVQKRWVGVANDNVSIRVIRHESATPLAEGQTWQSIAGWDKITDDSTADALGWEFVPGQIYTFPRGASGYELTHVFEGLPARNPENGNYYVYGVYEIGTGGGFTASYAYGSFAYGEGGDGNALTTTGTIVTNTSTYNADGSINLTAAKDLEGKEQKGRSWNATDSFALRLIPVAVSQDGTAITLGEALAAGAQPMPQPTATYNGVAYPVWSIVAGGAQAYAIYEDGAYYRVSATTSADGTDTAYTVADPLDEVTPDEGTAVTRAIANWAYVTANSGYVTPTERSTTFDAIHFTVQDLIGAGGTYDNNNNLSHDFWYVMRERIPNGAVAYLWKYELVAGTTDEYMRVATEPAAGVEPYEYGVTPDATRELYVWRSTTGNDKGVYFDTSMDLVQIHVSDSRTGQLSTMVTHHKMVDARVTSGSVDTSVTHPTPAEVAAAGTGAIAFGTDSVRTQPVFDNYYDAEGVATVSLQKFLAQRAWADGDSFTFTLTPATGNESRPMPELDLGAEGVEATYEGEGDGRVLVSATDGTTTVRYDAEGNVTSASITLTKDSATGASDYVRVGAFSIPVELDDMTRATASSAASATFIYRIEETVPADAGGLVYTTQPVYARVTVTDDARGGISSSVTYTWDEAGNNPVLEGQWLPEGTGTSTSGSAAANFVNRQTTMLVLTKGWKGFGTLAVQDSTFQLQSSTDGTTWADVEGETRTVPAGYAVAHLATWADLPAYDANGAELRYRAVEVLADGSVITVAYLQDDGSYAEAPHARKTGGGGFAESVQNTYEAEASVSLATVKELNGRDWLASDAFTFVLEPTGFSTYDASGAEVSHEATGETTLAEAWQDVHGAGGTFPMPGTTGSDGTFVPNDEAVASTAQASQGYLGEHQYLAPFESLTISIHDLTLNQRTGFMTGDFYYDVHEVITIGGTRHGKAALDAAEVLPEGVTRNADGTYTYAGMTYDLTPHTAHVHVQGNRVGELIVTSAYDEATKGDTSTGTRFTPVIANSYEAAGFRKPNVSKSLLTRDGSDAWGTNEGQYSDFFFVQRSINGAPFQLDASANAVIEATGEADAIARLAALADPSGTVATTGDAIYLRLAYGKNASADDAEGRANAYFAPFGQLNFSVDDLGRTATGTNGLTYSDGTTVPAGHKYDIFEYSFNEVVPTGTAYDYSSTLAYDTTTEYSRVTVIDRGDGTLDFKCEFAGERLGTAITLGASQQAAVYDTTTSANATAAKLQFTNSELVNIDVTKSWDGTQASEPVTFQLYRTANADMVADAATYRVAKDFAAATDEAAGWVPVEGATVTIPAGAHGAALTAAFSQMPVYNQDGERYIYRVGEVGVTSFDGGETYVHTADGTAPSDVNPALYALVEYGANVEGSGDRHFTVTNTSAYESDGVARVSVVKELEGRNWLAQDDSRAHAAEDAFSYVLTAVGKAEGVSPDGTASYVTDEYGDVDTGVVPMPASATATARTSANVVTSTQRQAPFDNIAIGEGDLVQQADGTWQADFYYTISEQVRVGGNAYTVAELLALDELPEGVEEATFGTNGSSRESVAYQGITYDPTVFGVHVHAEDDGAGSIVTTVQYTNAAGEWQPAGSAVPVYVNSYGAEGDAVIEVAKQLQGLTWEQIASRVEADPAWAGFTGFQFTLMPVGDVPVSGAATGDNHAETITVTLDADQREAIPSDYSTHYEGTFEGRSGSEGLRLTITQVTDDEGNVTGNTQTPNHNRDFTAIHYTLDDMPRNSNALTASSTGGAAGSFIYAIQEVAPSAEVQQARGLEYDDRTIYAKVTMEDDLEGNLVATVRYYSDAACTQENLHVVVTALDEATGEATETTPSRAAILKNAAFTSVTAEKRWVGEATRGSHVRLMRATAASLANAGVEGISATTRLSQGAWASYVTGGTLGNNTNAGLPAGWSYVPGVSWTFPQNPYVTGEDGTTAKTGWTYTFTNLPTRDEDGNAYVYGIWEGGNIELDADDTDVSAIAYGTDEATGHLTVTNTSAYSSNGTVTLTAGKDLEGKEQKGRSWTADDEYAVRLIPVSVAANADGSYSEDERLADDAQPMPVNAEGEVESWTYITATSNYVTPTERQGVFDTITFTMDDLVAAEAAGNGGRDANNRLYADYWYVMRELIPDGAVAYRWHYELVAGTTGEYLRVATTKASGVSPYRFAGAGATSYEVREAYVWEKDGVFYDTTMDLVHVHVADGGNNALVTTVEHHRQQRAVTDTSTEHPTGAEASGMPVTFSSAVTRTQPVFDNYYDATGTALVNVDKTLYGRVFGADDAFTVRLSAATGNDRPLPTGADAYWGVDAQGALVALVAPADGSVPAGAVYADLTLSDPSVGTPAGEVETSSGTFSIPVELASLSRASVGSVATATFVYRLEEVIPADAVTDFAGTTVAYADRAAAGMTDAEVAAATWRNPAGDLAYTTTPVYAHVSLADDTQGGIEAEVSYFWDEAGREPVRVGGEDATAAPFANTTMTAVYVEKDWAGFDYAVQDTTLQLQQTNVAVGRYSTDADELASAKENRYAVGANGTAAPNGDAALGWADATLAGGSVTFATGTPTAEMHHTFAYLPTYDASGRPVYYRVVETSPSGVAAIKTSYTSWFSPEDAAGGPTAADARIRYLIHVENAYEAGNSVTLSAVKELQGRAWADDDAFAFRIEPIRVATAYDAATGEPTYATDAEILSRVPMPADDVAVASTRAEALGGYEHLATFGRVSFSLTDLVLDEHTGLMTGDFWYQVAEQLPDGVTTASAGVVDNGDGTYTYERMTYDLTPFTAHVHVQGNNVGDLICTVAYNEETVVDAEGNAVTTSSNYTPVVVNVYEPEPDKPVLPEDGVVAVRKAWDDADDQDGTRPSSVTVQLYRSGLEGPVAQAELTAENGWTTLFTDLPTQTAEGEAVRYSVAEAGVPEGYALVGVSPAGAQEAPASFVITNRHVTATTEQVTVVKRWVGDEGFESMRADVVVSLFGRTRSGWERCFNAATLASGAGDGATYTFETDAAGEPLPAFHDGEAIEYHVVEQAVPGYETSYSVSEAGSLVVTNTWAPRAEAITVVKSWEDDGDRDGLRPDGVRLGLVRVSPETGEEELVSELDRWLDEDNGWEATWDDLPDDGLAYAVRETGWRDADGEHDGLPEGYECLVESVGPGAYVVHNVHDAAEVTISAVKVWADDDDAAGLRPAFVTLHLYADGAEVGNARTASEPAWAASWTMPRYGAGGQTISYEVVEEQNSMLEAYSVGYAHEDGSDSWVVVNTLEHGPEVATAEVRATKVWDDAGHEGERAAVTLQLLRRVEGEGSFSVVDERVVAADATGEALTVAWEGLPLVLEGAEGEGLLSVDFAVAEAPVAGYASVVSAPVVSTADDGHSVLAFTVTNAWQGSEPGPGPEPGDTGCKVTFVDSFGTAGSQILRVEHFDSADEAAAAVAELASIAPEAPDHAGEGLVNVGWAANLDTSDGRGDWVVTAQYTVHVESASTHTVSFVDPLMGLGAQLVKSEQALAEDDVAPAGAELGRMADVTPPADPDHTGRGYFFAGWGDGPYVDAGGNWIYVANYRREEAEEPEPVPEPTPGPVDPAPVPTPAVEPEPDLPKIPQTSDPTSYGLIFGLAGWGVALILGGLLLRREE